MIPPPATTDPVLDQLREGAVDAIADYIDACIIAGHNAQTVVMGLVGDLMNRASA